MAGVVIDSGPVAATDRLHSTPRPKWFDLMIARKAHLARSLPYDCRCLIEFVNDAETMFPALGFTSADEMVQQGYGLDPQEITYAVDWLRLRKPDEPISLNSAVTLGKQEHGIPGGKPGPGRGNKTVRNTRRLKGDGSVERTLARLDRDRPDLAARVRAGELSANAAAIEAGWRKVPSALDQLRKAWKRATRKERNTFLEEVG